MREIPNREMWGGVPAKMIKKLAPKTNIH